MKKRGTIAFLLIASTACASVEMSRADSVQAGKIGFEKNCSACHPGGGNIINQDKPLKNSSLAANGITDKKDIIRIMRDPGPGMTSFSVKAIPDKEAKKIAEYILKTFRVHP